MGTPRYLFLRTDTAAQSPRKGLPRGTSPPPSETDHLSRAFPNIKFHVEWQDPSPSASTPTETACTLHIHTAVEAETLHSVLTAVLRKRPRSVRPYVMLRDTDINSVVIHRAGSITGRGNKYKLYHIESPEYLSIQLEDGDWSRQRSLDGLKYIFTMLTRKDLPLPAPGTAARAQAESRTKTVEVHFPNMSHREISNWLQFVS